MLWLNYNGIKVDWVGCVKRRESYLPELGWRIDF